MPWLRLLCVLALATLCCAGRRGGAIAASGTFRLRTRGNRGGNEELGASPANEELDRARSSDSSVVDLSSEEKVGPMQLRTVPGQVLGESTTKDLKALEKKCITFVSAVRLAEENQELTKQVAKTIKEKAGKASKGLKQAANAKENSGNKTAEQTSENTKKQQAACAKELSEETEEEDAGARARCKEVIGDQLEPGSLECDNKNCPDGIGPGGVFVSEPTQSRCVRWHGPGGVHDQLNVAKGFFQCQFDAHKNQKCTKMSVSHVDMSSTAFGLLLAKRVVCKNSTCSTFKTGLCINLGFDNYIQQQNRYIPKIQFDNMKLAQYATRYLKGELKLPKGCSMPCYMYRNGDLPPHMRHSEGWKNTAHNQKLYGHYAWAKVADHYFNSGVREKRSCVCKKGPPVHIQSKSHNTCLNTFALDKVVLRECRAGYAWNGLYSEPKKDWIDKRAQQWLFDGSEIRWANIEALTQKYRATHCLGTATGKGVRLALSPCGKGTAANQKWELVGGTTIRQKATAKCIGTAGGHPRLVDCDPKSNSQQFNLIDLAIPGECPAGFLDTNLVQSKLVID